MAGGFYTTDSVDLNEVYYKTVLPSVDRYNQYDFYPFRETLCSNGDESYVKYPIGKVTFAALGEAETPNASKINWARFKGTTEKTGAAFGYTYDFLKDCSMAMINDTQAMIYDADRLAIQNLVLDACFDNTSVSGFWNTYLDTESDPKAYGRMIEPPDYGQNSFDNAHTHYEALNTTTIALTQFTGAKQHIAEHGQITNLVAFINSAEVEKLENLAGWSSGAYVANPIVSRVAIDGFAGRMLGIDFFITEAVPAGYILIVDTGNASYNKPVKFIEPNNASYRGLILIPGITVKDYPIIGSYFLRWMGAKVWQRGAGYVMYLAATSTYTAPTLI